MGKTIAEVIDDVMAIANDVAPKEADRLAKSMGELEELRGRIEHATDVMHSFIMDIAIFFLEISEEEARDLADEGELERVIAERMRSANERLH